MDIANRWQSLFKRCYWNYLNMRNLYLNSPNFNFLQDFVVLQLNTMKSHSAQAFLKSDEKDGLRDTTDGYKNVKVYQVVYGGP